MTRRLGLLGGSFNPVHNAHLALARCALDTLRLDALTWLPAGRPWQKNAVELAPAADRLAMLALAIDGEPCFRIDRCEIDRQGATYTIDTLAHLRSLDPDAGWVLIVGQDQWARFDSWRRWPEILRAATIAVAGRGGETPQTPAAVAAERPALVMLPLAPLHISATAIRARVAAGLGAGDAVPPAVARYIDRHHLYRTRT